MIGFKVLVTAGLLLIGGLLVLNQEMNIGQFVAAEIIILLVINSVEKLITGIESFYDVLTSLEKIGEVVDKELESQEGTDPFEFKSTASISFDRIAFTDMNGNLILDSLSLDLAPTDRLYVDGPSGSGKTTLLKLLSGLIETTEGAIYINDYNFKGMRINAYRSHVGQVIPEQMPFEGTILENITFGNKDIPIDTVNRVIKDIGLQKFVRSQAKGIDSPIFSQGQSIPHTVSKRLLLARSIVHDPKILLLKDALEHFEPQEARDLMEYLAHRDRPWLLIASGQNEDWKSVCNKTLNLNQDPFTL
jgi:ABC-type bacteriocin/lantibiotic exporter with double-glycine peptidase domain